VHPHFPLNRVQKPLEHNEIRHSLISVSDTTHLGPRSTSESRALLEIEPPFDSSAPVASSTVSGYARPNSIKRSFDECLSTFPSDETSSQQPRKRQAFAPRRRKQVARTRKVRACQRCKMNKLPVGSPNLLRVCLALTKDSAKQAEHVTNASKQSAA
jgi:hypothetical protein